MNLTYGAITSTSPLEKLIIRCRGVKQNEVKIDISYYGTCHWDIH